MKLYIDMSVLTLATFVTGIQRVTREMATRLSADREIETILLHYNAAEDVYYKIDNVAFQDYYLRNLGVKERMITKEKVPLSQIGEGSLFFDLDAAWMCRMKRSYLLPILKRQGVKIVAHLYDIISVTHPQYCLERGVYHFMDFLGAHLQYADAIITNAQATVQELTKLSKRLSCSLPPCHVVMLGANFESYVTDEKEETGVNPAVRQAAAGKYVLMVGTIEPRKNHKLLLNAYDRGLKQQGYQLIMAGYMGWNMEKFEQTLKQHPDYGKGVYHFAGLDDVSIHYLYRHARLLAFASYTEGFGLPIIESIKRGTPVLAADLAVYREIAKDACIWFPQDNVEKLCEAVVAYDQNPQAYADLKERMHHVQTLTWEETFVSMKKVLQKTSLPI